MFTQRKMVWLLFFFILTLLFLVSFGHQSYLENLIQNDGRLFYLNLQSSMTDDVNYFLGNKIPDNHVVDMALPFLMLFIIFCVCSIIFLIILLTNRRIYMNYQEQKLKVYVEKTQELIIMYLYDNKEAAIEKLLLQPRKVVIDQIVVLTKSIIGNKAEKLKELFFRLNLDIYVAHKALNFYWHVRVKYLDIANTLNLNRVKPIAKKFMDANNIFVRRAAIKAYISIGPEHSFSYLHSFKRKMTDWHQMNLYQLIVRQSITPPDFYQFLTNENPSVVHFALRMIQLFHQEKEEDITYLLHHPNYEVRIEAVKTLKTQYHKTAVPLLINTYHKGEPALQKEIIEAIGQLNTQIGNDFLVKLFKESSLGIRLKVLKSLNSPLAKSLGEEYKLYVCKNGECYSH